MKQFVALMLIVIGAVLLFKSAGCELQDNSECTRDVTNNQWICPEENK